MADLLERTYNPDVLSCLANLSNDEVFTPPDLANRVLDMLPAEIWSNPDTKILDPCCKSGVFLREAARRLTKGLEPVYPDLQERVDHIMHNQLFGISITELTSLLSRRSLYCSKFPNGRFSVSAFDDDCGRVRYHNVSHTWRNGHCDFCGASESEYRRDASLETHAYEFIHTNSPERIFNMKFDVIVGNPPYQLSDGGNSKSAVPIYQKFVLQAEKLSPRYLTMIIPSRWFSGGRGLDEFRSEMLSDKRIRKLVDYESFRDAFPNVDLAGGACYFLWDRDNKGKCEITNASIEGRPTTTRYLDRYPVFIRDNKAVGIVDKVIDRHKGKYLDSIVYPSKPFGLRTYYKPTDNGIPCWFIQRYGKGFANPNDVTDNFNLINKWKLLIPRSPIAGQTDFSKPVKFYYDENTNIAQPGECCTESFLVAFASHSKEEVISFKTYLFTKVVRFLLLQAVVSQDVTRKKFCFVPDLGHYEGTYSDNQLCKLWDISDDEFGYIASRIGEATKGDA